MGKKISELGTGVTTALDGAELFEIEKSGASGRTNLNELKRFISPVVAAGFIGDLPDPATLGVGELVFNASHPAYLGSMMYALPSMGLYSDFGLGSVIGLAGGITSGDNTDEQELFGFSVPRMDKVFVGRIIIDFLLSKSSGAIAATLRIRLGSNGDLTDPVVQTVILQAATRTADFSSTINIKDAVTVVADFPLDNGQKDTSQILAPVSVDDMTTGARITVSIQHASTGCVTTLETGIAKTN